MQHQQRFRQQVGTGHARTRFETKQQPQSSSYLGPSSICRGVPWSPASSQVILNTRDRIGYPREYRMNATPDHALHQANVGRHQRTHNSLPQMCWENHDDDPRLIRSPGSCLPFSCGIQRKALAWRNLGSLTGEVPHKTVPVRNQNMTHQVPLRYLVNWSSTFPRHFPLTASTEQELLQNPRGL